MRTESFTISYPPSTNGGKSMGLYSLNAVYSGKGNWQAQQAKRSEDKRLWRALTISAMNKARVGRKPFEGPVDIAFLWDDALDADNHAYVGKLVVDAMKGRMIKNDSRQYVRSVTYSFHDGGNILVRVIEAEENQDG